MNERRIRVATGMVVAGAIAVWLPAGCGAADGIEANGAWARTSPAMATTGAVYMELSSSDANRLVAASVSDDVAAAVEIHETATMDTGDDAAISDEAMAEDASDEAMTEDASDERMADEHMAGAMVMRQVTDGLILPAGETLSLAPGGYHLMLLDLADPLESGETFDVTLEFEDGQTTVVSVAVQLDEP